MHTELPTKEGIKLKGQLTIPPTSQDSHLADINKIHQDISRFQQMDTDAIYCLEEMAIIEELSQEVPDLHKGRNLCIQTPTQPWCLPDAYGKQ